MCSGFGSSLQPSVDERQSGRACGETPKSCSHAAHSRAGYPVQSHFITACPTPHRDDLPPLEPHELVKCVAQALMYAIDNGKQPVVASATAPSLQAATAPPKGPGIFDSSAVPNISVDRYLQRLKAVFQCSEASFVLALIIVDRLLEVGARTGQDPQRITMWNVHRLFLASLIVTVKFNEDLVYGNSHYAKAGGTQLREVNRLERFLLRALDYDFHVQPEQYSFYERALRKMQLRSVSSKAPAPEQPLAVPSALPVVRPPALASELCGAGSEQRVKSKPSQAVTLLEKGGATSDAILVKRPISILLAC